MPRTARIDIPGVLYHVIVRGIERRDIFLDDEDRLSFVQRLSSLIEQTNTSCLAWGTSNTQAGQHYEAIKGLSGWMVIFSPIP